MKINRQNNKKLKVIIIVSALLLISGGAYTVYSLTYQNNEEKNDTIQSIDQKIENTSPDPKSEVKDGEPVKSNTNTDQPKPVTTNPDTNLRSLQVSAFGDVSNGTISIRGGIDNSVEFDGLCFAILTGPNGAKIRKDTTLLQNASTTDCATIQFPASELTKGEWSIILHYTSKESTGTSNAFTIKV